MRIRMMAYIIPFKPKSRSKDWQRDSYLLDRTIDSIVRQDAIGDRIRVVVVGNDQPESAALGRPNVVWLESDVALNAPTSGQLQYDKLTKCHRGLLHARSIGASHVMLCDSDDLLSKRMFACIEAMPASDVYSVKWGYGYSVRRDTLYRLNRFYGECATAHVYRVEAIGLPRSMSRDEEAGCLPLSVEHGAVCQVAAQRGLAVRFIPIRAATYVVDHGGNMLANVDKKSSLRLRIRQTMKHALRWSPLTRRVRDEFGLAAFREERPDFSGGQSSE